MTVVKNAWWMGECPVHGPSIHSGVLKVGVVVKLWHYLDDSYTHVRVTKLPKRRDTLVVSLTGVSLILWRRDIPTPGLSGYHWSSDCGRWGFLSVEP